MFEPQTNYMDNEIMKNGLSKAQAKKAHEILKAAGIEKSCKAAGISPMTVKNVLRGISPGIEGLYSAMKEAKKIIEQKQDLIKSLPG